MEEFDEADVLWPEDLPGENEDGAQCGHLQQPLRETRLKQPAGTNVVARRPACTSAPVRIPEMVRPPTATMDLGSWARRYHSDGGGVGAASFVAPHEITARRRCASEERSVCVGQGRTLKGRDLLYLAPHRRAAHDRLPRDLMRT